MKRRRASGRGREGQPAGRHTPEYVQQQPQVIHGQPNRDGRYPLGEPGREGGNEVDERGGNDRYAAREAAA